ncbi:MAG: hypothetical protein L3J82_09515 [Planctomycetes bacterium]|nr:hypothetical protein [Planctomycetota bacterium]
MKKALTALDGVKSVTASVADKNAKVTMKDGKTLTKKQFTTALEDAGYEVISFKDSNAKAAVKKATPKKDTSKKDDAPKKDSPKKD